MSVVENVAQKGAEQQGVRQIPLMEEIEGHVTVDAPGAKGSWKMRVPLLRIFAAPAPAEVEAAKDAGAGMGEWAPFEEQGSILRVKKRKAAAGFYAPSIPGAPSTTRQAEILNTALIAAPTGVAGVAAGRDVLSQTAISKDPITDYNATPRLVTSTNVLVIGNVGSGKSSYTKTVYVLRPLILRDRRAVVFDKKNEDGEGEYAELVRFHTNAEDRRAGRVNQPVRFALDGSGVRFNLLDPTISGVNDDGMNNQLVYLNTVPALIRENNKGADEWERKALRLAYREMMTKFEGVRTPTTADLHDLLGIINPKDPSLYGMSPETLELLHKSGISMRLCFNELLETYGAIFDGETSKSVQLNKLMTSFDISQLPDTGPSIPMVMGLANLWLLGTVRRDRGIRTNVLVEEAGHILSGPMAIQQRSNIKLSRGLGLSNIYNIHNGATDVLPGSPGMAVIEEAQTVHIFRQDKPEAAEWCVRTFGLNPDTASDIMRLENGHHFLKTGTDTSEIEIEHVRSSWEVDMTNTDGALAERPDAGFAETN
jgi:hypothetical protein